MKILIVEDDAVSLRVLAAQLRKLGHDVLEAENGAQGWNLFQQTRPNIVITDWMMPDVDGPELCRRIRGFEQVEYPFLIILTAVDRQVGYLEGMHAGADDFVTKPADIDELAVRLRVAERIVRLKREVHQLEGLLPICPRCRKIKVREGEWEQMESYITKRSEAHFTHGICPDCYRKILQPQIAALRNRNRVIPSQS